MSTAAPVDGGDPAVLVEVAERHRKTPPPAKPVRAEKPRAEKPSVEESDDEAKRPRRRLVAAKRDGAISTDTLEEQPKRKAKKPTARAAPAGAAPMWARLGAWGIAGCAAALAVLVLTVDGLHETPPAMPVGAVRISWLPGPQLPPREVLAWLDRFPAHDKLREPNPWVLDQLAQYLREQAAVAEVRQVRLVHEPAQSAAKNGERGLHRTLELVLALRQPVMPVVLASGERAWLDADARVLPGIVPGPNVRRPMLRALESAKPGVAKAALAMWTRLEPQLEQGLITDVVLDDALDDRGARGIVLYTRQGSRLIWGDPGEERYGVNAEAKARDLVHTLRCQGDLARVATINVRFSQPFFTFRE
jgi:hypothetical protein